jgi:hypothetical protein
MGAGALAQPATISVTARYPMALTEFPFRSMRVVAYLSIVYCNRLASAIHARAGDEKPPACSAHIGAWKARNQSAKRVVLRIANSWIHDAISRYHYLMHRACKPLHLSPMPDA